MLTLHGQAASRAIRPIWAALEAGVAFHHEPTPYQGGATRTPAFLALNPNGHIPVLVDGGAQDDGSDVVVWESMACVLYLARHHAPADGVSFAPATRREDAEALRWSFWTVNEVEADALTVLMHRMVMPAERRRPELAEAAERRLAGPLGVLNQHLQRQQARGEAHLAAARFTVADLCVASVLNWARPARALMDAQPEVQAWLQRCLERPAYLAAKAWGVR